MLKTKPRIILKINEIVQSVEDEIPIGPWSTCTSLELNMLRLFMSEPRQKDRKHHDYDYKYVQEKTTEQQTVNSLLNSF